MKVGLFQYIDFIIYPKKKKLRKASKVYEHDTNRSKNIT